jgi:hypothetical protein
MMIGAYLPSGTLVSGAPGSPPNLKISGRDPETGRESPFLRHTVKEEYSSTRRRWEYVERVFNRLENSYVERCYDKQTGLLMFEKPGRRDDRSIHGARGKRK